MFAVTNLAIVDKLLYFKNIHSKLICLYLGKQSSSLSWFIENLYSFLLVRIRLKAAFLSTMYVNSFATIFFLVCSLQINLSLISLSRKGQIQEIKNAILKFILDFNQKNQVNFQVKV